MTSNYVILSIKLRLVQYINIYFGKLYRGWEGGGGGGEGVPGRRKQKFLVEIGLISKL